VVVGKIPRFWTDLQIECLDIVIDYILSTHTVTNFQKSFFRRAQRDSAEKTSKFGPDESPAQNENYGGLFHIHSISYRLLCFGSDEYFCGLQSIDIKPIALRNR
jgi:hypothetical protein